MCGFGASEGLEKSASPLLPDASKASSVAQTSPRTDPPQDQYDGVSSTEQEPTSSRQQAALHRERKFNTHGEDREG